MYSHSEPEEGPNKENQIQLALWNNRYVQHYYELMKKVRVLYRKGGDDFLSGFKIFDQDRHNFEEAMRLCIKELVFSPNIINFTCESNV